MKSTLTRRQFLQVMGVGVAGFALAKIADSVHLVADAAMNLIIDGLAFDGVLSAFDGTGFFFAEAEDPLPPTPTNTPTVTNTPTNTATPTSTPTPTATATPHRFYLPVIENDQDTDAYP